MCPDTFAFICECALMCEGCRDGGERTLLVSVFDFHSKKSPLVCCYIRQGSCLRLGRCQLSSSCTSQSWILPIPGLRKQGKGVCVLHSVCMVGSACACVHVSREQFALPSSVATTNLLPLPPAQGHQPRKSSSRVMLFYFTLFPSLHIPALHCSLGPIAMHGSSSGHAMPIFFANSHPHFKKQAQMHLLFQRVFHCCWQLGLSSSAPAYNAPFCPHQEQHLPNGLTSACLLAYYLVKLRTCSLGPIHLLIAYG